MVIQPLPAARHRRRSPQSARILNHNPSARQAFGIRQTFQGAIANVQSDTSGDDGIVSPSLLRVTRPVQGAIGFALF
jgi:hypothetical protein